MNYWITSDNHFSHINIIKLCNRPFFSVDEMNEVMISNWNAAVDEDDVIYHLGDIFWTEKSALEILPRLKGKIKLLLGNHDKNWRRVYERRKFSNLKIFHNDIVVIKEPINAVLCHYPLMSWNGAFHGVLHFSGHTHNNSCLSEGNRINVCVENTNYKLINLINYKKERKENE